SRRNEKADDVDENNTPRASPCKSPAMMENFIFRQKLGLSCRQTIDNNNGSTAQESGVSNPTVSRCLFGLPDPKLVKDLVREIELKNALSFGKRFNFDIIQGEPFPGGKLVKKGANDISDESISDEENIAVEEEDGGSFMWTESYDQDYMAKCNNHACEPSLIGPNRRTVSLLFAPIVSNHQFSSSSPSLSPASSSPTSPLSSSEESPIPSSQQSGSSALKKDSRKSLIRNGSSLSLCNNRSSVADKNQMNSQHHLHPHLHNIQHPPSAKKSSSAHQIIAKYTNNLLRHALNKKPRKSLITDFLKARRRQHQLQKKRTP
ncbi:hypothetical protein Ocin01_06647, partial [Orchesella cincta]